MNLLTASASVEALYEHLASLLLKNPKTIEILPGDGSIWMHPPGDSDSPGLPSYSPFLFLEENLGIPERVLYQVYLHAVGVFKFVRSRVLPRPPTDVAQKRDSDDSLTGTLVASSSVLILANPSHATALNVRKLLVRMRLIDPHAELQFMASLLSSRHCVKHAELWYHRRWLLAAAYGAQLPITPCTGSLPRLRFTSREILQQELDLSSRACELYPRNYFAWTHRAMCMRSLLLDYLAGLDTVGFVLVLRHEIAGVKEWIDRHISDYSAIHLILMLSQIAIQSKDPSLVKIIAEEDPSYHAIILVQEHPAHQALWMYIQSALSILDIWHTQQTQQFIDCFVQPLAYPQYLETGLNNNLVGASQYARQFLERGKRLS